MFAFPQSYFPQVDGAWFKQYVSLKVFRFQDITSKEVKEREKTTLTCTVVGLTSTVADSDIKWTKSGETIPATGNTVSECSSSIDRSRFYPDGMITVSLNIEGSKTTQDDTVTCHFQVSVCTGFFSFLIPSFFLFFSSAHYLPFFIILLAVFIILFLPKS